MAYAIYHDRCYRMNIRNGGIRILSNVKEEGFNNAVSIIGEMHNDLFVKEVSEEDLDFAYDTKYLVDYQGQTFEILSSIGKRLLGLGRIFLFTDNRDDAKKYGFEAYDNLSFKKPITINEVDRIAEIKIPILRFKGMEPTQTIIEKDQIMDYIMNLIE